MTVSIRKKVLHFGYSGYHQPGVLSQLKAECVASRRLGIDWDVVFFSHENSREKFVKSTTLSNGHSNAVSKVYRYFYLRFYIFFWLARHRGGWDVVLLRNVPGDPFIYLVSLLFKKYITVHHSKEHEEVALMPRFSGWVGRLYEKALGPRVLQSGQGVIAVTQELIDYELSRLDRVKAGFVFPNGITVNANKRFNDRRSGVYKLIGVYSQDYEWNGLDYIYDELRNNDRTDIEIHLVGKLKPICEDCRIVYHGVMRAEQLEELYSQMDVGLGVFGLHRKSMNEACTLKSREYLANGLGVYAGHKDSALPLDFAYYCSGVFNLNKAVELAKGFRKVKKEEVFCDSVEFVDKASRLSKLYAWIQSL
ncbi:hypothetical protein MIB92_10545 [Aestuariirhabdus sp. Z084]|uniref:hypothetical protein n=1 Tax=Aestuariirhabdus haliotis TaxID=2918751 RepID=UPI00201B3541|nr:hypothetical protein [Aestuariirhabdus haliotis]MCL6416093.1 hypothetical protein [Aestuariirhabdus haliotis]MCL6419339.1 hypothetical protein [Aestuariirhabdus haliotis]